jgi:hypothetical protein
VLLSDCRQTLKFFEFVYSLTHQLILMCFLFIHSYKKETKVKKMQPVIYRLHLKSRQTISDTQVLKPCYKRIPPVPSVRTYRQAGYTQHDKALIIVVNPSPKWMDYRTYKQNA